MYVYIYIYIERERESERERERERDRESWEKVFRIKEKLQGGNGICYLNLAAALDGRGSRVKNAGVEIMII